MNSWSSKLRIVWDFVRYLVRRFEADQCRRHSAALTFTTLFAVVPMMTVTYSMLSAIPSLQGAGDSIQAMVFQHLVPSTGDVLLQYLRGFTQQARKLTSLGIIFLIVTAFMMIKTIEAAFNAIWQVPVGRKGVSSFLLYWAILSLGPLLIGFGFGVSSYLASLPLLNDPSYNLGFKQDFLSLLPMLFSAAAFTLLYAAVPNYRVPIRHALAGGVGIAILFELAKTGFTLFVTTFPNYQFIYGAFAAVPLFLFWVYLSWVMILMGAEFVRALAIYEPPDSVARRQVPVLLMLRLLHLLWQQHLKAQGNLMTGKQIMKLLDVKDIGPWREVNEYLLSERIMHRTEKDEYALSQPLERLDLWGLLINSPWPLRSGLLPTRDKRRYPDWLYRYQELLQDVQKTSKSTLSISISELFNDEKQGSCLPKTQKNVVKSVVKNHII